MKKWPDPFAQYPPEHLEMSLPRRSYRVDRTSHASAVCCFPYSRSNSPPQPRNLHGSCDGFPACTSADPRGQPSSSSSLAIRRSSLSSSPSLFFFVSYALVVQTVYASSSSLFLLRQRSSSASVVVSRFAFSTFVIRAIVLLLIDAYNDQTSSAPLDCSPLSTTAPLFVYTPPLYLSDCLAPHSIRLIRFRSSLSPHLVLTAVFHVTLPRCALDLCVFGVVVSS